MPFIPNASGGQLSGSTTIIIVPPPATATTRQVTNITVQQADTVAQTFTFSTFDGITSRPIWVGTLNPGDSIVYDINDALILPTTSSSIRVAMGGSPTTTNPYYNYSYNDIS
jgi:hypothetical protein